MQKKCIQFCRKLDKIHHISKNELRLINWLPTSKTVDQWINTITYNFINSICPYYLNEIFQFAPRCRIGTKNNFSKLKNSFRKLIMGQKAISYIAPSIWNNLPDSNKRANSLNTFKHNAQSTIWLELHIMCLCEYVYMICICLYVRSCVYIYMCIYISVFSLTYWFWCCCCCFCFFFLVFLFSHFRSNLRDYNENKPFLPILRYLSHCWCYSYLSATSFFTFKLLISCLFVCLFSLFILFRLIFRCNKFCNFSSFM